MKIVEVENLRGDEVLANPILTDDYQVLMGKGTRIKKEYIEKLKELDISEVYIEEYFDIKDAESNVLKEEIKDSCVSRIKGVLEKHTYNNNAELQKISKVAETIICDILENTNVIDKVYEIKERGADIYEHSISVCTLATIVGIKLGMEKELLYDIGMASLLHDLGLRYIVVPYKNVEIDALSEKDAEEYRKHTIYGYTAIVHENWLSDRAKKMILFHHEKKSGTGYPLRANDITLECQIISICEAFDELLCGVGKKRVKVHEAIEYLKMVRDVEYDGAVVDALMKFTAVFPTGTTVRLSDKSVGMVVRQSEHFPERPVIRLMKDKNGKLCEEEVLVDLVLIHNIVIEEVID